MLCLKSAVIGLYLVCLPTVPFNMDSISVEWGFSLLCKHQHDKEGGLSAPWGHEKCLVLMVL